MKKYNKNFERDFNFYFRMRNIYDFDGSLNYFNNKGNEIVIYDKSGVNAKEAFYQYDSNGKITPTKHPNLLCILLKVKGSVNLHIKMYAEDRANLLLSQIELRGICIKYKTPIWFREAINKQTIKFLNNKTEREKLELKTFLNKINEYNSNNNSVIS